MNDFVTIEVEETLVRFNRSTNSKGETGVILGRVTEHGHDRIYLDRRIHKPDDKDARNEWTISGPFTTILSRPTGQPLTAPPITR